MKYFWSLLFLLCLFLMQLAYGYYEVIDQPPDGIHIWRQSDGASMAYKYFSEKNGLLEPEMHNRLGGTGKAVGEFPLMYYAVGQLYRVFGFHHWVYKALWILINSFGLLALFHFCKKILRNKLIALLIALMTYTIPIYSIYSISYIIDPIALSCLFMAWYFAFAFYESRKWAHLIAVLFLIGLAGVFKITVLISFFAAIGAVIMVYLFRKGKELEWLPIKRILLPLVFTFLMVIGWFIFVSFYNEKYDSTNYFFLRYAPIWELEWSEIVVIWDAIDGWSREYSNDLSLSILGILILFNLSPFFRQRLSFFTYWLYLFSVLGAIAYFLLFYSQFFSHDYYIIVLVFILPLTLIVFFIKLKGINPKAYKISVFLLIALFVQSFIHANKRTNNRLRFNTYNLGLNEFKEHLDQLGVDENDLVFAPFDLSPNVSLNAIKRDGYSGLTYTRDYKLDSLIELGVKWMIISDERKFEDPLALQFQDSLKADTFGVRLYKLSN